MNIPNWVTKIDLQIFLGDQESFGRLEMERDGTQQGAHRFFREVHQET